jgi:immunity protein Imm1 of predicted polymorphic toxin system
MAIALMITDEWQGGRNHEQEVANPPMEAIEQAVIALDASVRTLVVLELGEGAAHMAVGGGSGQYVVYMTDDNVQFEQLTDGSDDNARVLLCAGGQEGEYARRLVVDLDAALGAVRHYARKGEADRSLRWIAK